MKSGLVAVLGWCWNGAGVGGGVGVGVGSGIRSDDDVWGGVVAEGGACV